MPRPEFGLATDEDDDDEEEPSAESHNLPRNLLSGEAHIRVVTGQGLGRNRRTLDIRKSDSVRSGENDKARKLR